MQLIAHGAEDAAAQLRTWLTEKTLPLWLRHGIDPEAGAFHEHLDRATKHCGADHRRLRVAARQTFVFAEAARLGVTGATEAGSLGLRFLCDTACRPDGLYASRFSLRGDVRDGSVDFYDQAFVLLAFAATGERARACALVDAVRANLSHPEGGYAEGLPPRAPRRQNPHMHWFEACLHADQRLGAAVFRDEADAMRALFSAHFLRPQAGMVAEYFDASWTPERLEDGGFLAEPGHACEWVSLLAWHDRLRGAQAAQEGYRLMAGLTPFAGRLLPNAVSSTGTWLDFAFRLWPQTERVRAEAVHSEPGGDRHFAALHLLATLLHEDGTWTERLTPDGLPLPGPMPASSLYHLFTALSGWSV